MPTHQRFAHSSTGDSHEDTLRKPESTTTMVGHWMGYQQAETDYGHRPSEIEQLCQAFHELQPKTPTPPPAPQAPNRDAAQVH